MKTYDSRCILRLDCPGKQSRYMMWKKYGLSSASSEPMLLDDFKAWYHENIYCVGHTLQDRLDRVRRCGISVFGDEANTALRSIGLTMEQAWVKYVGSHVEEEDGI